MYQRIGAAAYKVDLSNTLKLCAHLIQPQEGFKSIHVAGTNGKGSTSHMLASVLQEAGYKVGLYTSPHLKDFRERIKINGKEISKQFVIGFIKRNKSFFKKNINYSCWVFTSIKAFFTSLIKRNINRLKIYIPFVYSNTKTEVRSIHLNYSALQEYSHYD